LRLGGVRAPAAAAGLALAFGVAAPASSADPLVSTSPGAVGVGFNGNGELGDGTTISSDVAVRVTAPDAVTAVAAGGYHSLGLLNTGEVMSWGYNGYGELGDGTTANSEVPVEVPGLNGVTAISAGEFHSLALLGAGTVMAWGANNDGQLGDGTTSNSDTPVEVRGLTGVAAVSAGGCGRFPEGHSLALLTTGRVMAWGGNQYGQLGNGTTSGSDVPVEVPGLREVVAVSAGEFFSLALLKNGRVMAWGRNNLGQLGDGTTSPAIDVPVEVTELAGVTAISAGGCGGSSEGHSLALLSNGAVTAWGYNGSGELGNGTTANSDVPVKVRGLAGVTAVSAGTSHSVALRQNGTVAAWGANYSGQLGDGSTTPSDVPVAMTERPSRPADSTRLQSSAPQQPPPPLRCLLHRSFLRRFQCPHPRPVGPSQTSSSASTTARAGVRRTPNGSSPVGSPPSG
jgi:alpha-tubulin suppressor-like RCC1 family protein